MAGDLGLAASIALVEVQLAFVKTTILPAGDLGWVRVRAGIHVQRVGDTIRDVWQSIVDWLATALLKSAGVVAEAFAKSIRPTRHRCQSG